MGEIVGGGVAVGEGVEVDVGDGGGGGVTVGVAAPVGRGVCCDAPGGVDCRVGCWVGDCDGGTATTDVGLSVAKGVEGALVRVGVTSGVADSVGVPSGVLSVVRTREGGSGSSSPGSVSGGPERSRSTLRSNSAAVATWSLRRAVSGDEIVSTRMGTALASKPTTRTTSH